MAKFASTAAIEAEIGCLEGNHAEYRIFGEDLGIDDPAGMLRFFLTSLFGKADLVVSEIKVANLRLERPSSKQDVKDEVKSTINLLGVNTKSSLAFRNCEIGTLKLSDAVLRSVYIINSTIFRIEAARLKLSGSFDCSAEPRTIDFLDLSGAEIGGNLDLSCLEIGASVAPPPEKAQEHLQPISHSELHEGIALRADGITVRGNMYFREVTAHGELRLNGCTVGRNVDLFRSDLRNSRGFALSIAGGDIRGNFGFALGPERTSHRDRAKVQGTLRLNGSKIRGRLDLSWLDLNDEAMDLYALECQGIEVGGRLSTWSLTSNRALNLSDAMIHGGWTGETIYIDTPNDPGILGNGIKINGLVDLINLQTTGFFSFCRGEFRGGFRLTEVLFTPDRRETEARVEARPSTACKADNERRDHNKFEHSIENWRSVECGLILDHTLVLGSFELGASIRRAETTPCIPPHWDDYLYRDRGRSRFDELEKEKKSWRGAPTWLCLDTTTVPEIDRTAFRSFTEFDLVDLSNCTYKSVITREESVMAERSDRSKLNYWRPQNEPSLSDQKREKVWALLKGKHSEDAASYYQLDAPDVDGWLKILDRVYAPLAYQAANQLPKWAQHYNRRALSFALLMNGLLFMGWEAQFLSCLILFLVPLSILELADRHLPHHSWLQWLAAICLGMALGGWILLRKLRVSRTPTNRKVIRTRVRNYLLRYDYGHNIPVFHPQPYLQLARTMRNDGFDKHAADVIVAMEWRRTWYGDLSPGQQVLQWIKGMFLEFGFNRLRPITWQVILVVVSMFIFQYGYETGAILPAKSNEITPPGASPATGEAASAPSYADGLAYVRFNGLLYSAETVLPLTDFGQKKNWIVEPIAGFETRGITCGKHSWGSFLDTMCSIFPVPLLSNHNAFWKALSFHWIAIYSVVVTALGYLMSVLFIAGITGIITPKY